jgi:DUF4097 and DUF4098 domain-containing protein YvlB
MRPRSVTGPIVLIVIGLLFLLNNLGSDIPIWSLFADYWPALLIVLGIAGLVEVLYYASRGAEIPPRPLGGGGWFWLFIAVMFCVWSARNSGIHIGRFGSGGVGILGNDYEYDVNSTSPSQGVTRVVLDNIRGNLSVKGDDSSADVKVTGHKTVRAFNHGDADRGDQQSQLHVERQGDLLVVRAEEPKSSRMLSITTDLDISLPKGLSVEARGRSGDLTIEDVGGAVDVTSGRGDIRLNNIGRDVKIESSRGGLIRAADLKGGLDLQGRGGDVQIENVQGPVTINGEYSGTLEFRSLAKPLRFTSARTEFRVEQIPGSVTMDLGELKIADVVGPVRFQTGTRDVQIADVTNSLELQLERGDVKVTESKTPLPKMEVRSRNGDITVTVPEKAGFELDGRSGQGEVQNDFGPAIETHQDGRAATIKGKTGSGPLITLTTERGSVSLRKN